MTFGAGGQRSDPLSYGRMRAASKPFGLVDARGSLAKRNCWLPLSSKLLHARSGNLALLLRRGRDSNPRRSVNPSPV